MINLITYSDFIGDISLPIDTVSIDLLDNEYIPIYQKDILVKLLGQTLYSEFETAISGTPAQKWIDLRDGKTYQDYDDEGILQSVKFEGLKNIVKYYVYFKYVNDLQRKITTTGQIEQNNVNSIIVAARTKLVDAWNSMLFYYGQILNVNKNIHFSTSALMTGVDDYVEIETNSKLLPSAYNFIRRSNELVLDTYANWNFVKLKELSYLFY